MTLDYWTQSMYVSPEARDDVDDDLLQHHAVEVLTGSLPAGTELVAGTPPYAPPSFTWSPFVWITDDQGTPGIWPAYLWGRQATPDVWLLVVRALCRLP